MKIPKDHDLLKLRSLVKNTIDIDNFDLLDKLNQLYIESRYPGDMGLLPYGKPTVEDAEEFYESASSIFDRVCEILEIDKNEIV